MTVRRLIPALVALGVLMLSGCSTLDWGADIRDPRVDPGERRELS